MEAYGRPRNFVTRVGHLLILNHEIFWIASPLSFQSAELPQFKESTYELTYNVGTTTAMRGKYNEALQQLKKAEQACTESVVEDGGTEEEAKHEAAIIR